MCMLVVTASLICTVFTGRMSRSGKLPVLNLLTSRKYAFSPRRGHSLHRFTWNLEWPRGTWVCLVAQNFKPISTRGGNAAPKSVKFPLFGKESSHRGEPFDRFLQLLGAFMRPTTLRMHFKFDIIRFTGYGVIAEKPRVGHLPRIFPCIL